MGRVRRKRQRLGPNGSIESDPAIERQPRHAAPARRVTPDRVLPFIASQRGLSICGVHGVLRTSSKRDDRPAAPSRPESAILAGHLAIPDHWPRVREIFEAALALPADIRRSYVAKACDGDELVSQEVELLLGSHERATGTSTGSSTPHSVLDTRAPSFGDAAATRSLEGNTIGPYLLGPRIGAGGMGDVYKARDTRLNRTVAIKVCPRVWPTIRGRASASSAKRARSRR